jgi:DNA-binding GntR family transcriptional regulator
MRKVPSVTTRVDQVYAMIRDSICDCTLQPGTHLVQEELAAELGVSRQPVQQAMLLLKADGLVIEAGGRGLYVAPMDAQTIEFNYQIRIQLDRLAARLVAERAANPEARQFRAEFERKARKLIEIGQMAQRKQAAAEAVALDVDFHALIYEFSGNPLIAKAAAPHWNFLRRVMINVLLHAGRGEKVWQEHEKILQGLLRGDPAVEDEVEQHITGAQKALLSSLMTRSEASVLA